MPRAVTPSSRVSALAHAAFLRLLSAEWIAFSSSKRRVRLLGHLALLSGSVIFPHGMSLLPGVLELTIWPSISLLWPRGLEKGFSGPCPGSGDSALSASREARDSL